MDTPLTAPPVPLECSHLKYLKIHKFAELLRVAVPCITWLFKAYQKGTHHPWRQRYTSLPSTGSQNKLMARYAAPPPSNKLASIYEYSLSQPTTAQGNSSRILPATKSPTYLFLIRCWLLFSECTTPYTDPTRSVSAFSIMFVTGMSTAAASQLSSTNVERLHLI